MNRVALITGASRGIGKETAYTFAKNGYDVVINYHTSKDLAEKVKKDIEKKYKVRVLAIKADVGNEAEVSAMVKTIVKELKRIDVLVNNAGIYLEKEYMSRTVEDFLNVYKTNTVGMFVTSKYVAPVMKKQKYGKIVNISSNNAFQCYDPVTVEYDCSKAAVNILTRVMSQEFAPYINVNAVAPGWVATETVLKTLDKDMVEAEGKRTLKQKISSPSDIAELVLFLASDKAEMITGEIYRIDGGM